MGDIIHEVTKVRKKPCKLRNYHKKKNQIVILEEMGYAEVVIIQNDKKEHRIKIDIEDVERVSEWTWGIRSSKKIKYPYVKSSYWDQIQQKSITFDLHRFLVGAKPGQVVDHANHDTFDCRKNNLRICSVSQNLQNSQVGQERCKNKKSKYRGVCWIKRDKLWRVSIRIRPGKRIMKYFKSELDAARQYDIWAKEFHGEFAILNFSDET
jgi:hypothetical protein